MFGREKVETMVQMQTDYSTKYEVKIDREKN